MAHTIIKVEDLGKKYRIGHLQDTRGTYVALRDVMADSVKSLHSKVVRSLSAGRSAPLPSKREDFWALKDISFEVQEGERLGIIGRNGAGKSTLLKVLSRITEPTTGKITIGGRVASLLEVGTGFHPELTGRENVYLNGAILGMTRAEIRRKFDEIVQFAEVERFLDTPVKHFSSGMYVRLAFAVAAHLEPEILIVDEVLAVGDSVFQKKCIDKMTEVSTQGRTILFVSHNFAAVRSLCSRAMLLNKGSIVFQGGVQEALDIYAHETKLRGQEINLAAIPRNKWARELLFERITFEKMPVPFGEPIVFTVTLKASGDKREFHGLDFGFNIYDKNQSCIIHCSNRFIHRNFDHLSDEMEYRFAVDNNLKPGLYYVTLFLRANEIIQDYLMGEFSFEVAEGNPYKFNDTAQIQGTTLPAFSIEQIPRLPQASQIPLESNGNGYVSQA